MIKKLFKIVRRT